MRLGLFAFLAATLVAASARADFDWLPYATVSQTLSVSPSRLCMGASQNIPGRHLALGCPSYAPSLTTGGDVSITGNVSANKFIGDGSGLTGVTAGSSDRIVSGTTSMVAISTTGYISLTQSGVNTGWFNPQTGFVTIGVSSTGPISGTNGYFSGNVGIGTTSPGSKLEVYTSSTGVEAYSMVSKEAAYSRKIGFFWNSGGTEGGVKADSTLHLKPAGVLYLEPSSDAGTGYTFNNGYFAVGTNNSNGNPASKLGVYGNATVGTGYLTTAAPTNGLLVQGTVGIGTGSPYATLHIASDTTYGSFGDYGQLLVGGSSSVAKGVTIGYDTTGNYGWIYARQQGVAASKLALQVGGGGVAIGTSSSVGTLTVLSGDTSVSPGISIRQSNARTYGYDFDTENNSVGRLDLYGVSNNVRTQVVTFMRSGNVGIATTAPAETLHVSGTTRLVSNVAVGMNATPSATLDISGTMKLSGATGAEVCDSNHYNTFRTNPATGEVEICTP